MNLPDASIRVEETHRETDILDLAPVGPGIHPDGAADAPRYARAELHPG